MPEARLHEPEHPLLLHQHTEKVVFGDVHRLQQEPQIQDSALNAFLSVVGIAAINLICRLGVEPLEDDMATLREKLLQMDMAVFVTLLYYFGMSSQLKMVIDWFCGGTGHFPPRD